MEGRNEKGKFIAGNPGGPGRPPAILERGFSETFRRVINAEKFASILEKLTEMAIEGDVAAAGLILRHALPTTLQVEQPQGEYRVAGMDRSQVAAAVMERMAALVAERRLRIGESNGKEH